MAFKRSAVRSRLSPPKNKRPQKRSFVFSFSMISGIEAPLKTPQFGVFRGEGERLRAPPGADAARKKLCAVVEICRARAREQISGTTNGKSRPDGLYRNEQTRSDCRTVQRSLSPPLVRQVLFFCPLKMSRHFFACKVVYCHTMQNVVK